MSTAAEIAVFEGVALLGALVVVADLRRRSRWPNAPRQDATPAPAEIESRIGAMVEHLPGAVFRLVRRPDGSFELPFLDGNLAPLIGVDLAQARAQPARLVAAVDGDDVAAALRRLVQVGVGSTAVSCELRYRTRDGNRRWLVCNAIAEREADGTIALDGIALDVGPEKQADKRAAEAEALLIDAIDSAVEGIAVYGPDYKLVAFNKDYPTLLPRGMRFEIGEHFDAITRRIVAAGTRVFDRPGAESPPGLVPSAARFVAAPIEQLLIDGRWLRVSTRPTRAGGLVVVTSDITERRKRERELANWAMRLAGLVEHMPIGVVTYDAEQRMITCNEAYRRLLDLPEGLAAPGTHMRDIRRYAAARGDFGPGDPDQIADRQVADALAAPVAFEAHIAGERTVEVRSSPLPDGGIVATIIDMTERQRMLEAEHAALESAAEAARIKSDFLANMSHELRTPLNAIIGFSEVMGGQMLGPLPDRYREYADDIAASARHLLALIGDILDLSKLEAGRVEIDDEDLDLGDVVRDCFAMVETRARKGGLALEIDLPPDAPRLRGDRRRVMQVLLNLLTNAVKFTPLGGHVALRARIENGGWRIDVVDTGIGIAAEDIPRVMQEWGQARSDLSRAGEGTGLGLPLSRRLMELHGGSLALESRVGAGTTVSLWFPPERVVSAPAPSAPVDPASARA